MKRITFFIAALLLASMACSTLLPGESPEEMAGSQPACLPANASVEAGYAVEVIDGDTIDASIDGQTVRVRYIGVDTPEIKHMEQPAEYYGPEASAKNADLVEGQKLLFVKDVSETDKYGRLLRYVFVDSLAGVFVNYELVRQGYAYAVTFPPDVSCADDFRQAEQAAKSGLVGLWGQNP